MDIPPLQPHPGIMKAEGGDAERERADERRKNKRIAKNTRKNDDKTESDGKNSFDASV